MMVHLICTLILVNTNEINVFTQFSSVCYFGKNITQTLKLRFRIDLIPYNVLKILGFLKRISLDFKTPITIETIYCS